MKQLSKSLLAILNITVFVFLMQPAEVLAKTKRTTNVRVQNLTGLEIESVSVVHKYSNVYKEKMDWGRLENGKMTTRPMKINYNTGFLTTGQDWWLVTWKYKGNNSLRYTAPRNFRGIIDFVEKMHLQPLALSNRGINKLTGANLPTAKLAEALMNLGSTKGFKKHFLKKKDQKNGVIITITHNSVAFDSASGHSSTEGIRTKMLPEPSATTAQRQPAKVQRVRVKQSACAAALDNKIAWDYKGNKRWNPANIRSLCGNSQTAAPAVCFKKAMHGGVNWGGGTKWKYQNAMNLCRNATNPSRTITCFRNIVRDSRYNWQDAIKRCKAK